MNAGLLPALLAAFGVALAIATYFLRSQRGKKFRTPPPRIIAGPALVSGLAAAFAGAHPTEVPFVDNLLCFVIGAVGVLVGLRATRWPIVASLALLAAASMLGEGAPAAVAFAGFGLGVAVALRSLPRPSPMFGAIAVSLGVHAALRLPTSLPTRIPSVIAIGTLSTLAVSAYSACRASTRRRSRRIVLVVAGGWAVLGAIAVVGLVLARSDALAAVSGGRTALRLVEDSNSGRSTDALDGARADVRRLTKHLSAWWMRPALAVPVLGQHIRAFEDLGDAALDVVDAARATARLADVQNFRVAGGGLDVARLRRLQGPSSRLDSAIANMRSRLDGLDNPWLVSRLTDQARTVKVELVKADAATANLRRSLAVLPGLLGADGPRRYLLVVPTPAEARGSGGVIGNYGELVAENGHVTLAAFGRASDLRERGLAPNDRRLFAPADYAARYGEFLPQIWWQNVTMSPDFPSAASVMADLYPQSGGRPVDGVVSIDPLGLAALLQLTGPISVPGWPEPITAANAARTLLFDQYVKYPSQDPAIRAQLLGSVATSVWLKVSNVRLPAPRSIGDALGPAARGRHLQLWSKRPEEQRYFSELHASGALWTVVDDETDRHDGIAVVTNNGSANKIEWFLHRRLDYDVVIDRRTDTARATLDVTLRNEAPASGLPRLIIGNDINPPPPDGTSRLYVSVYTRLALASATIDGRPVDLQRQEELGAHVYSVWITIPSRSSVHLILQVKGRAPSGRYGLEVAQQPVIAADQLSVKVRDIDGRGHTKAKQWQLDQFGPVVFSLAP